jgi:hypothetical protein
VTTLWYLVLAVALIGAVLIIRSLRDVRDEVTRTVDSFSEFQSALAPALGALREQHRLVAAKVEQARSGSDAPRG